MSKQQQQQPAGQRAIATLIKLITQTSENRREGPDAASGSGSLCAGQRFLMLLLLFSPPTCYWIRPGE